MGHRSEAYEKFGKISARTDDTLELATVENLRTGPVLVSFSASWDRVRWEAALHASPNAGWSEAAMATHWECGLAGANFYDGERVEPRIQCFEVGAAAVSDIQACLARMWLGRIRRRILPPVIVHFLLSALT